MAVDPVGGCRARAMASERPGDRARPSTTPPSGRSTALSELHVGRFGDATYETVRRVVATVVRRGGYPPPDGGAWTSGALDDLVHDVLAERDGPVRIVRAARTVRDDHELDLLLGRIVRNHLVDRSRRTEIGRLHRRLRRVLDRDGRFVVAGPGAWRLHRTPPGTPTWDGPLTDLTVLVRRADPPPRTGAGRPVPTAAALADLCEAVIDAAGAPVRLPELRSVVAAVAGLSRAGPAVEVTSAHEAGTAGRPGPGAARLIAVEVWARLDDRERTLLGHLDEPVRAQGPAIGLGHSQASVVARRLRERLRAALSDDGDPEAVAAALLELQDAWRRRRDPPADTGVAGAVR